jgi:hypothetical protein
MIVFFDQVNAFLTAHMSMADLDARIIRAPTVTALLS